MSSGYTPLPSYRKTGSGEWVVMALATELVAGEKIAVTKRNGASREELIVRVGRPFSAGGHLMAYGYIATSVTASGRSGTYR